MGEPTQLSRRDVLRIGVAAVPTIAASNVVFGWLTALAEEPVPALDQVDPIVAEYDAKAHRWGFVVDARACIGCGACVVACKAENGVPFDGEHTRTWVERHTVALDERVVVESPDAGMHGFAPQPETPGIATDEIRAQRFVPRLCMQCEDPPCVSVCPVSATYRTADGVILVDEQRCIGCGYCIMACPYGARYLVPAGPRSPAGVPGVADKCTFCYHRIVRGRKPACVEICPVKARKFGDLNDPASEVSAILRDRPSKVMKAALGTNPRVHYLGLEDEAV